MKVQKIKILLATMIMSSAFMCGMPVKAYDGMSNGSESGIELQYVSLEEGTATLAISGGTANCRTLASCKTSKNISITMTLQKASGNSWINVTTWSGSKTSTRFSFEKSRNISKGKYRVKAKIKYGSDSKTTYSSSKSY